MVPHAGYISQLECYFPDVYVLIVRRVRVLTQYSSSLLIRPCSSKVSMATCTKPTRRCFPDWQHRDWKDASHFASAVRFSTGNMGGQVFGRLAQTLQYKYNLPSRSRASLNWANLICDCLPITWNVRVCDLHSSRATTKLAGGDADD